MKLSLTPALVLVASIAIAAQPHAGSQPQDAKVKANLYPLAEMKWADGPPSLPKGAKLAVLEGDPTKEGPFVFRLKVPDGYRVPPHTHPKTERITVIAGTLNFGMGDMADEKTAQPMPAGTYGYWPADMTHFVFTKGETILQFHGEGPWTINYVNPADDPRNAKSGQRPEDAGGHQIKLTNQTVEIGCGSCIYSMKGVEGCKLAAKIDGKTYLVTGADHVDAHKFCSAAKNAIVSGQVEGDRFVATRVEVQP